jgi:ABC-type sugar transport system permease subunit
MSSAGAALRRAARGYPWVLPATAAIGLVLAYPIVKVVQYSFTDRTSFLDGSFVGLDNYRDLLHNDLFWRSFKNNLILLLSVPLSIVLALVITGFLWRGLRGTRVYELLIFIPFLPAVASIAVIFLYVLSFDGPLNELLRGVGADGLAHAWLAEPGTAIWAVLGVVLWKRIGFTVLLFSARMASIDRTLFDAAAVDGASWSRTYWQVAVPQLRSIVQFAAVLGFIEAFSWTFAYVVILTRGGPDRASYTLEYLLYRLQFDEQLVGLASAVAVVLLLAALLVAAYRVRLARREAFA